MPSIPFARIVLFGAIAALGISAIALLTRPEVDGAVAGITSAPVIPTAQATAVSSDPTPIPITGTLSGPIGDVERGRVVKVVDGDTLLVDLGGAAGVVTVRFIGIDAPEPNDGDAALAWMDVTSTKAAVDLVAGRTVLLEREVIDHDEQGLLLRDVWTDRNGILILVNLELIRGGFAQTRDFSPDVRYDHWLAAGQATAKASGLGIWGVAPAPSGSVAPSGTVPPSPAASAGASPSPS